MGDHGDGTVEEPINREPDSDRLVKSFLTPSDSKPTSASTTKSIAYERNHGPIQHLSSSQHTLTIKSAQGIVLRPTIDKTLTTSDLETKFPRREVIAALQCAGNRRHEMRSRVAEVQGIDWGDAAVMNAAWTGIYLRDVLFDAGLSAELEDEQQRWHVQFACTTQTTTDDDYYGSSIPLSMALDPDREVLLALEMNGAVLPDKHGFPLRVIVPGVIGARSVKWLDSITISDQESTNHYQRRDYKVLTGDVAKRIRDAGDDQQQKGDIMDEVPALMDNVVNCVIAIPGSDGDSISRDEKRNVRVEGYAIPQGKDGPIVKVEVSIDNGKTWHEAELLDQGDENNTHEANRGKHGRGKFAWVLWHCDIVVDDELVGKEVSIWSRATDQGGNTMDVEKPEGHWNLRGVAFNAVEGRRRITIV